jgi:hypothetical protein
MDPRTLTIDDLVDYAPDQCMGEETPLFWQMTRAERFCLIHLLRALKPELSLEVGTHQGGSLQVLSRYSVEVYSVDIDPGVAASLRGQFPNVSFTSGDSTAILPSLIDEINASEKKLGLVLIDGDHSEEAVQKDINAVLRLIPRRPLCIVMHDSFHPPCRKGIRLANWQSCPYTHYLELDFVHGIFVPGRPSADESMFGGFALALLLPERRAGDLSVFESQLDKFNIVHRGAAASGCLATSVADA